MKLLLISGDDDYGFLNYEQSSFTEKEVYEKCVKEGRDVEFTTEDGDTFCAQLYEFGDVDHKFVNFIKAEIMDYDAAKNTDFVVIEE